MTAKATFRTLVGGTLCLVAGGEAAAAEGLRFERDIRPLLSDRCFACHGPDEEQREAELRLDRRADAFAERDGRRAIVPGKPQSSELWRRISSSDDDERMPPPESGKKLSPAERELLKRWLEAGADWSEHWAYVLPREGSPPTPARADWAAHPIDAFAAAALAKEGRQPAPEADRVALVRRLYFDLTGLPPSPGEVQGFVNDRSPEAWPRLVDRLLASEAYGERMASYWLDLVRYADTVGYHGDQEHHISPYRDWVIDAFIDNMPLDKFTRDQLAGDLVPGSGVDEKIASGYNRLLQTSHEGGVQEKEYLAIYAADRVRNFGSVWLAATTCCAQCHNHKFDPITAVDFYSLAAFFADLDDARHLKKGSDTTPTVRLPELKVLTKRERYHLAQLELLAGMLAGQAAADETDRTRIERIDALRDIDRKRAAIERSVRLTMISVDMPPRPTRVLPRGNWLDESGPLVEPAVPACLGKLDTPGRRATRLDLATWLYDTKHGIGLLTARVHVNRLWYLMFGQGIADVLDDFGGQGIAPAYPELLDWLASELARSGWNQKHVLRLIATSRTYRQQADRQPTGAGDVQVATGPLAQRSFRIPAEAVRDSALDVAGLLVRQVGGPSVRPYQPAGYYQYLNFPRRDYKADTGSNQWRRGLYVHWQRQFLHPMLRNFDAPRREECTAQRVASSTPLAALTLLNDPTFIEAARGLAARVLADAATDESRVERAFRLATSRSPDVTERGVLLAQLKSARDRYEADEAAAKQFISIGQSPAPDGVSPVDLAAWTSVTRIVLNLGETYARP